MCNQPPNYLFREDLWGLWVDLALSSGAFKTSANNE
jgi:hypothetical protein